MKLIRNFAVIAHIDHGKSTLADRIIQLCGTLTDKEMVEQVLDSMDLERERGITIKAQTVHLQHRALDGRIYHLNLIDTPGHVDFSYEVSRSLGACEACLLLVDATQGVEAQSVANCYIASDLNLPIIPVLNKIDLPSADPDRVCRQIEEIIGIDASAAVAVSARTGAGVEELLEKIVAAVPQPDVGQGALTALIYDAWFDQYLGIVVMIRVRSGSLRLRQKIRIFSTKAEYTIDRIGHFTPKMELLAGLDSGEIGFFTASIKTISAVPVGDTVTCAVDPVLSPIQGFQKTKPFVYAGIYPGDNNDFPNLRDALQKLALNDSALDFELESSSEMGFGFRCGFLGLLHMEIVRERLEREHNLELIITAPMVEFKVLNDKGELLSVRSAGQLRQIGRYQEIREPFQKVSIFTPREYVGAIINLCISCRGCQISQTYHGTQANLIFELPMIEILMEFFNKLKSISRGMASMDYEFLEYRVSKMVVLDILINGERVDPLSLILFAASARRVGLELTEKLKEIIPRQMVQVAIQAAIGSKIIARTNISALRKNVTAKCYGGDITRKRKLLEKQKEGKKRMRQFARVDIPRDAFVAVINRD
ncbi:MAG: translation elongation factor 4 [Gammaproteobacteria bacterium]|nr:translation elongation factor 4 [Pseudomonadota bacterium]MCH9663883.1 translation elongation factor 4 [Gammaproteobacteria bacterium]